MSYRAPNKTEQTKILLANIAFLSVFLFPTVFFCASGPERIMHMVNIDPEQKIVNPKHISIATDAQTNLGVVVGKIRYNNLSSIEAQKLATQTVKEFEYPNQGLIISLILLGLIGFPSFFYYLSLSLVNSIDSQVLDYVENMSK